MRKALATLWVLALMLEGCAALGLATPQTFNQKLAVAYGTVTEITVAADNLLTAKKISADDAQNIQGQIVNAKAALDIARVYSKTDAAGAATKLDATLTALTALQAYLATKGK